MAEESKVFRIRTKIGADAPNVIHVPINQTYDMFEILSLKLNQTNKYKTYQSDYGVIVGRIQANQGFGVENAKISIFLSVSDDESENQRLLYDFTSVNSKDNDGVRYNVLPDYVDDECHQNVGTFPNKRLLLDNQDIIEVFDKYWKYTTTTNSAGDYMFYGIPVGTQTLHCDVDLSDCGVLSQKPHNMIAQGYNETMFDSPNKFKYSTNLNKLPQILSQEKSIYVYPYWGDISDGDENYSITRCDIDLDYEFKPTAVFIGSAITDSGSNAIGRNCTATTHCGRMEDLVTSSGKIEMIRKTVDGKVEEYAINGNNLIDENGVWVYDIPMNLDYVTTDEYGNVKPTQNTDKGIPTRARVRFRITLSENEKDVEGRKRARYLVPNNPMVGNEDFNETLVPDYEFGSATNEESFCDMFWNNVYTVKNYIPKLAKHKKPQQRKHTGIKGINHYGDNNPMPYNGMTVKLSFTYRISCVVAKFVVMLVKILNTIFTITFEGICDIANLFGKSIIFSFLKKPLLSIVPYCVALGENFCDDEINPNIYYPGCGGCIWKETKKHCKKENKGKNCITSDSQLNTCIENDLIQDNDASSFNFYNDWINGVLYFPLWYRKIKVKQKFFFGILGSQKVKDEWCSSDRYYDNLKVYQHCAVERRKKENKYKNFENQDIIPLVVEKNTCGDDCHKSAIALEGNNGVIKTKETMLGQTVYYYVPSEFDTSLKSNTNLQKSKPKKGENKIFFATDIVLLGNLNECNKEGIPQFFNYLESTTYKLPSDILFTDYETENEFDSNGNLVNTAMTSSSEMAGCDWGNENEYGKHDSGLFYSVGCSSLRIKTKSCINLSRICEFGVSLDETKEIPTLASIYSEGENAYEKLITDGFISYDELNNLDGRSMFATMNGNRLKTITNTSTGLKEYDFHYLYTDNFDSSLYGIMKEATKNYNSKVTYKNNYKLELFSADYYKFRMGNNPYFYDKKNAFPRYENSFYFYFGLKNGKTAIDKFLKNYVADCSVSETISLQSKIKTRANSWCSQLYSGETLTRTESKLTAEDVGEKFIYTEKSVDEEKKPLQVHVYSGGKWGNVDGELGHIYTVVKIKKLEDGTTEDVYAYYYGEIKGQEEKLSDGFVAFNFKNIEQPYSLLFNGVTDETFSMLIEDINDEKIIITDVDIEDGTTKDEEISKYINELEYVRIVRDDVKMLKNGDYKVVLTDGNGEITEFTLNVEGETLKFRTHVQAFEEAENSLLESYKTYTNIANDKTNITIDEETLQMTRDIGGIITVYDITLNEEDLDKYKIRLTPNKNIDKDYVGVEFNNTDEKLPSSVTRQIVKVKENEEEITHIVYGIGVPKGNMSYTLSITQGCDSLTGSGEIAQVDTQDVLTTNIFVNKVQDYDMFINEVPYSLIKNFNKIGADPNSTIYSNGWKPKTNKNINSGDGTEKQNSDRSITFKKNPWFNVENVWSTRLFKEIESFKEINFEEFYDEEDNFKIKEVRDFLKGLTNQTYEIKGINFKEQEVNGFTIGTLLKEFTQENVGGNVYYTWSGEYIVKDYSLKSWQYTDDFINNFDEDDIDDFNAVVSEVNDFIEQINDIIELRNELPDLMYDAFYILYENEKKEISITVQTTALPYVATMVYQPEETDEDSGENKLGTKKLSITYEGSIDDIEIPTITYACDEKYGLRKQETISYVPVIANCIKGKKDYDRRPFYVGAMNYKQISIPYGLKAEKYSAENAYRIKEKQKSLAALFDFPIIDKKMSVNYISWAYFEDMSTYHEEDSEGNSISRTINMRGLLACELYNGIIKQDHTNGIINKFEEQTLNEDEIEISDNIIKEDTYIEKRVFLGNDYEYRARVILDTLLAIPYETISIEDNLKKINDLIWKDNQFLTKDNYYDYLNSLTLYENFLVNENDVAIIEKYGYNNFDSNQAYTGWIYYPIIDNPILQINVLPIDQLFNNTSNVSQGRVLQNFQYYITDKTAITNPMNVTQYCPLENMDSELIITDSNGGGVETTIYGAMKVVLNDDSVNDCRSGGTKTISVSVENGPEETITYYIITVDDKNIYPLNYIEKDELLQIYLMKKQIKANAKYASGEEYNIFSYAMTSDDFIEISNKKFKSKTKTTKDDGTEELKETKGYGTTGDFEGDKDVAVYIVCETENHCRAISNIYDFNEVGANIFIAKRVTKELNIIKDEETGDESYELKDITDDFVFGAKLDMTKTTQEIVLQHDYEVTCVIEESKIDSKKEDIEFNNEITIRNKNCVFYGNVEDINDIDKIRQYFQGNYNTAYETNERYLNFSKYISVKVTDYSGLNHICSLSRIGASSYNAYKKQTIYSLVWYVNVPSEAEKENIGIKNNDGTFDFYREDYYLSGTELIDLSIYGSLYSLKGYIVDNEKYVFKGWSECTLNDDGIVVKSDIINSFSKIKEGNKTLGEEGIKSSHVFIGNWIKRN